MTIKVAKMSRKISHLSSIGRVFLTYIALMVIQNGYQPNVEGANILSKYKSGYNVDKVCFGYQRKRVSYQITNVQLYICTMKLLYEFLT